MTSVNGFNESPGDGKMGCSQPSFYSQQCYSEHSLACRDPCYTSGHSSEATFLGRPSWTVPRPSGPPIMLVLTTSPCSFPSLHWWSLFLVTTYLGDWVIPASPLGFWALWGQRPAGTSTRQMPWGCRNASGAGALGEGLGAVAQTWPAGFQYSSLVYISDSDKQPWTGKLMEPLQAPTCKKTGQPQGLWFLGFSLFSQDTLSWKKQCYSILLPSSTSETEFYTMALKKIKHANSTFVRFAEFKALYRWGFW